MFVTFPEEVLVTAVVEARLVKAWYRLVQLVGGPVATARAGAFVAGAAGVTSACREPMSSVSDATLQQDVARRAKAAASGTVDSTFG